MSTDVAFSSLVLSLFVQKVSFWTFFVCCGHLSCNWRQSDANKLCWVLHACQVAVSSVGALQNSLKQVCARSHLFLVCGKGFAFFMSHREHSYSQVNFTLRDAFW